MANQGKKLNELFELPPESAVEEPRPVRVNRKELSQTVTDLEFAMLVRERHARYQNERIQQLEEEIKHYHRFLHALERNHSSTKDHRAVFDLIERACQWSWAYRTRQGQFADIDRAAALELATKRLGDLE
jgi:hypothetical protein